MVGKINWLEPLTITKENVVAYKLQATALDHVLLLWVTEFLNSISSN